MGTNAKRANIYNERTKENRIKGDFTHRNQHNYIIMTSETDYHQFELKDQKRPIRPKLLKLTDDGRNRKKSKFKVIEKSSSHKSHCI